jgi:glycosyltransferase involved in cell wall biosynthesis
MNHDLAIIIPAYKPDFFLDAVKSVLNQTDRRFSLYIFDDASPHNLKDLLVQENLFDRVQYHRFEENVGQNSLVRHWNRCVESTNNEPWIWLFSDDDLMDPACVEKFYQTIGKYPDHPSYRFNTKKISADTEIIRENEFPETFGAADFLNIKLSHDQESYVVEFIFSREAFKKTGGFPDIPLAWAADDMFWVKISANRTIRTIPDAEVQWRYSGGNISSKNSKNIARIKLESSRRFVNWIEEQDELRKSLVPKDLTAYWYARQIRSLQNYLNLHDELSAVLKMKHNRKSVLRQYMRMKKERSRVFGWLKKFLS